jgi:hypothetical protein
VKHLLLVHHEGRGNEKSRRSHYTCPKNCITNIPHMGIFHERTKIQPQTSRHHKFIGSQHVFLSFPIRHKSHMFDMPSSHRTRPKLFSQFPLANLVGSELLPGAFVQNVVHRVYLWSHHGGFLDHMKGCMEHHNSKVQNSKRLEFFLTCGGHSQ